MARCPAGHESQASDYCDTCGLVIGGEPVNVTASPRAAGMSGTASSAPSAVTGAAGSACPVCQAERNGRFCEECGYDFDLAEAMPAPAPPEGGVPGLGGQGLDLDAELARAESQAAAEAPAAETGHDASPDPDTDSPLSPQPVGTSGVSASSIGGVDSSVRGISLVVNADRDYYTAQIERGDIVESEFPFPRYPAERRFTFPDGPVRVGRASASRGLSPEIDLTGPPLDPAVSHLHAQLLRHTGGWVVVDLGSANGTRLNDDEELLEAETEIPVKAGDRIHLGVWTTITLSEA